jgi:hypothetical protein
MNMRMFLPVRTISETSIASVIFTFKRFFTFEAVTKVIHTLVLFENTWKFMEK